MLVVSCTNELEKISILPLEKAVMVDESVSFRTTEDIPGSINLFWDFGDGSVSEGSSVDHIFAEEGIFTVKLFVKQAGVKTQKSSAIIRVHSPETPMVPQVILDTDSRCEADDQHYIAYSLYSNLDVLGINSIHNDENGSEQINYGEIFYILQMMNLSGTAWDSLPLNRIHHGAERKLDIPESMNWHETEPIVTDASNTILAAARGANSDNPVWVMSVGPCTNIASAVLQARNEGFDLKERIRVFWLGGLENAFNKDYNGGNDPWSVYVMGNSGIDFFVMLDPTSLKLNIDKRIESHLYPDNDLGNYLKIITPVFQWNSTIPKSIHDVCVPAAILSNHFGYNWVLKEEPAQVSGPDSGYKWEKADSTSNVRLVWDIDGEAMKKDLFDRLNGVPVE